MVIRPLLVVLAVFAGVFVNAQSVSIANGADAEALTFSSLNTSSPGVFVFDFDLVHDGVTTDVLFDQVTFTITDGAIDWSQVIAGAELSDNEANTQTTDVTIGATSITISNIPTGTNQLGEINDTPETKSYQLAIWFSTSIPAAIASQLDTRNIEITITQGSFNATQGSFAASSTSSGASNNAIDVDATELRFAVDASDTETNVAMSPSVEVEITDVNGLRDTDNSATIGTIDVTSTGTLNSSPQNASLTSGVATFSIVHTAGGTGLQLSAQDNAMSLSAITSSLFDINATPVIANLDTDSYGYNEGAGQTVIDQGGDATLTDADGGDLNGGNLTVIITPVVDATEDLLDLDISGTISLSGTTMGSNVSVGGNVVGTLGAAITEGNNLIVNFTTADATIANVQTLIRGITYTNSDNDNPTAGARTIRVTVNDGDGALGTSANNDVTVTVAAVNDAPVIGNLNGDSYPYTEEDGPTNIDQGLNATITDAENAANLDGGNLAVTISAGEIVSEDLLSFNSGTVTLGGLTAGSTVTISATVIGTLGFNIQEGNDLVVNLNSSATLTHVRDLIRAITYENTDVDTPTSGARTIEVTVDDGDGGTSTSATNSVTVTVSAVNDTPVIGNLNGDSYGYSEGAGQTDIDQAAAATLSDDDSPNFDGGNLTATITLGEDPAEDLLSFNSGTVTLSGTTMGSTVTVSATVIGTLGMAISEGNNLVVDFNSSATPALIEILIRAITYENTDVATATAGARTIRVTVNDGDGGAQTSANNDVIVTVTASNDDPVFTNLNGTPAYTEQATPGVRLDTDVDIADSELDAADDYNLATLTIARNGGANVNDNYELFADATYDVSGTTLRDGGTSIGTFVDDGAGTLTITFSNASQVPTSSDVDNVLRLIAYTNDSDDPAASVTLNWTFADGVGGISMGTNQTIVGITQVNDPPTLTGTANNPNFAQGGGGSDLFDNVQDSTIEASQQFTGFIITVSGLVDGADEVLNFDGSAIPLTTNSGTTTGNSIGWSSNLAAGTATITFTGATLVEDGLQALIDAMTYQNLNGSPTTGGRGVTVTSVTDNGGGSNTGVPALATSTVTVVNVIAPTLSAGDIVITGLRSDGTDEFTWVPLVDLQEGEVIYFTDAGWLNGDWEPSSNSSVIKYVTPSGGVPKGTRQLVTDADEKTAPYSVISDTGTGHPTNIGTGTDMFLEQDGDQMVAFQSSDDDTQNTFTDTDLTFLFAVTTFRDAWTNSASLANADTDSELYGTENAGVADLQNNLTAVAIGNSSSEIDNARFESVSAVQGTPASVLALVGNSGNWAQDNGGTSGGYTNGGSPAGVWNINAPPDFTALVDSDPAYTENDLASPVIFTGATIDTDESAQNLIALEITVVNVTDGTSAGQDEIINFDSHPISLQTGSTGTVTSGIFATFDYSVTHTTGTSVITIDNFSESIATVQGAINNLTYTHSSEDPSAGGRDVSITSLTDTNGTVDAENTSPTSPISTVTVTPQNDQPTLTAVAQDPTFTEGGGAVDLFTTPINASLIEAADNVLSFDIIVTNVTDGTGGNAEFITVDGEVISLETQGSTPATTPPTFGNFNYSVSNPGGTATITISGITNNSVANLVTVIDGLTYGNTAIPPSTTTRNVSINNLADTGPTGPGHDNINNALVVSSDVSITVNQPVLTNVRWLDANPVDGDIDQMQLTFDLPVDFIDGDGPGPGGPLGMDALVLTGVTITTTDFSTFVDNTVHVLDISPIAGTASPVATVSYSAAAGTNSDIVRDNTSLEVTDGAAAGYTDGAAPFLESATYVDTDLDGTVNRIDVTYSETITASTFEAGDWTITPNPHLMSVASGSFTGNVVEITVGSPPADNTALTTTGIQYDDTASPGLGSLRDGAANSAVTGSATASDGAAPAIIGTTYLDTNGNGDVDRIDVNYSEDVAGSSTFEALDWGLGANPDALVLGTGVFVGSDLRIPVTTAPANNTGLNSPTIEYSDTASPGLGSITDGTNPSPADGPLAIADGAAPILVSASYRDLTLVNGTVDRIDVTFSEDISGSAFEAGDWSFPGDIYGLGITGHAFSGSDVRIDVINAPADMTALTAFNVQYTDNPTAGSINDGPNAAGTTPAPVPVADGAPPVIIAATTTEFTRNGQIDGLVLTMSENVLNASSTINASTFDVGGGTYTGEGGNFGTPDDQFINVTFGESGSGDTDQTPNVVLGVGFLSDGTNALTSPQTFNSVTDGVAPQITNMEYQDGNEDGFIDRFLISFSEALGGTSILTNTNLILSPTGDFTGADFGTSANLLSGGETSLLVTLDGSPSTNLDTREDLGTIALSLAGTFNLTEGTNNNNIPAAQTWVTFTDGAAPVVASAVTSEDAGSINGQIDRITVTMSENIVGTPTSTFNASTFDLGVPYTDVTATDGTPGDAIVTITVNESGTPDTDVTPSVTLNPGTLSDGTNSVTGSPVFSGTTDGAAPQIVDFEYQDANIDGRIDGFLVSFSEAVTSASTLGASNLDLTADGDFNGAAFGVGGDQISSTVSSILVSLNTPATDVDTESIGLAISTLAGFSLQDDDLNTSALLGGVTWASFSDGAGPVVELASTVDANRNGQIDGLSITMSENLNNASSFFNTATFSMAAPYNAGELADTGTPNDEFVDLTFTEISGPDTDATPNVTLTQNLLFDDAGNAIQGADQLFGGTTDGAGPAIVAALTDDTSEEGEIDFIGILFSEDISAGSIDITGPTFDDFDVPTYTITGVSVVASDSVNLTLMNSGTPDSDALPQVDLIANQVDDLATPTPNSISPAQNFIGTADGAPASIIAATTDDTDSDGLIDFITLTYSENVNSGSIAAGDFTLDMSYSVTGAAIGGSLDEIDLTVGEQGTPGVDGDTEVTPQVTMGAGSINDAANNNTTTNPQAFVSADGASPAVVRAWALDNDLDGNIDTIEFELSEVIFDNLGDGGSFTVSPPTGFGSPETSGTIITSVADIAATGAADDQYISLEFAVGTWGTGQMTMQYGGTLITDQSPALNVLSIPALTTITDRAGPRVINTATDLTPFDDETGVASGTTISIRYSEEVDWDPQVASHRIYFTRLAPPEITEFRQGLNQSNVDFSTSDGSGSAGTVTITLPSATTVNSSYYTVIENDAFVDDAGNRSDGTEFDAPDEWNFTTLNALVVVNATATTSEITLELNADATVTPEAGPPFTDFVVTDGQGVSHTVTGIADGPGNTVIITVDLSTAIGDLDLDFDGSGTGGVGTTIITAGGFGVLEDFVDRIIDFDTTDPSMLVAGSTFNGDHVIVQFNDDVFNSVTGSVAGDWTIEDGTMTGPFPLGGANPIQDASMVAITDQQLRLNFSAGTITPIGNLFITYTENFGNDGVEDYGGNRLGTQTIELVLDLTSPTLQTASIVDATHILLDFDEEVQITSATPAFNWMITDEAMNTFIVAAITDGTPNDDLLTLTTQDFSEAVGDLEVEYINTGLVIEDFGSNVLGDIAGPGFTIDSDLNPTPGIVEITANTASADPTSAAATDLAMYRSTVAAATIEAYTPITITPQYTGNNINIYYDANLSNMIHQELGVAVSASPTIAQIFGGIIDFNDAVNDVGVHTIYITEETTGTLVTEGPALQYNIAFMDETSNSAAGQSFGETDNVGTDIRTYHPLNQTLTLTGNGLANISYNFPQADSSYVSFIPSAAGDGTHQISFRWQNDTTGVSATFTPVEMLMNVNASSPVFALGQSVAFGKNETEAIIAINDSPSGLDVAPTDLAPGDFYGVEVYHIVNGVINTGIGFPSIHPMSTFNSNVFAGGTLNDDIAQTVLNYDDPTFSTLPDRPDLLDGQPAYISGEWTFNPSAFANSLGPQQVDTLRFVTISAADVGGSKAIISTEDVFLYPNPIVTVQGVNPFYCEDDATFTVQANIDTYVGVDGVDTTGFITNGYVLNSGTSLAGPWSFHSDSTIAGGSGIVNTITPSVLGPGFYQIDYTSDPQTAAGTIGSGTFEFEIRLVETPPLLDITAFDANGGYNGTNYVFEYCSGDVIPNLLINTALPGSAADNGNNDYRWYEIDGTPITDGNSNTFQLDIASTTFFGMTNTPTGTQDFEMYVTRSLNLCESDSVRISIRIFDIPETPVIDVTDTDVFSDNEDYYFEYCSDYFVSVADQNSTYDLATILTTLGDPDGRNFISDRTYFEILDASLTQIDVIQYNGDVGYSINFDALPYDPLVSNTPNASPSGIESADFYIVKHVADSAFLSIPTEWEGCAGDTARIFTRLYTLPNVPAFADFTGDPHDLNGDGSVVQYYMCRNDASLLPLDVGLNVPAGTVNFEYEWFQDAGAMMQMTVDDREGERLSLNDLNAVGFDEAALVETPYTYYVRLRSNVNDDSGFGGCTTSGLREVRIIVFPDVVEPVVTVGADPQGELNGTNTTGIGNFDVEFDFCVDTGEGLDPATEFVSTVSYSGSQGEILEWFEANAAGDAIVGTSVASATTAESHTVTASDLRIQNSENSTFNFAVIYNVDIVTDEFAGCTSIDTAFVRINVSTIPATSFSYSGITATEASGTTFTFLDNNGSTLATNGLTFEIRDDGGSLVTSHTASTLAPFNYVFAQAGTYDGTLILQTTAGCDSTLTRRFQILEKINVAGSYTENFDADDGGWFAEFQNDAGLLGGTNDLQRVTSWVHGTPAGTNGNIVSTFDGAGQAWSTTGTADNRYQGGEISYIYSPSYDISTLDNPAIRFLTYRDLDGIKDGVVLQYSEDDGVTWTVLGDYVPSNPIPSSGQFWYTNNGISSAPGDAAIGGTIGFNPGRVGWADLYTVDEADELTITNGWAASTHKLTDVTGSTSVRFRFALSASGTGTDDKSGDGFAFDEMEIFQLGKQVLVEQFSSSVSANSLTAERDIAYDPNGFISGGVAQDNITYINYFTDLGNGQNTDPLSLRNTSGPGARAAYYGVEAVPNSALDGELLTQFADDQLSWNDNDIDIKGLNPARFDAPTITNVSTDPGVVSVSASFNAAYNAGNANLSFMFAIVEDIVVPAGGLEGTGYVFGDTIFNAFRKFVPGPEGFNYVGPVAADQDFNYQIDWVIDNVYDANNLKVAVFVQDNDSEDKEVMQSGIIRISGSETITGINDPSNFSVYPNPADDQVNIEFASPVLVDTEWTLFDQAGREIYRGVVAKGTQLLTLDTEVVDEGMYFFHLFTEENRRGVARIIITH